jgi:hypothetical protein
MVVPDHLALEFCQFHVLAIEFRHDPG